MNHLDCYKQLDCCGGDEYGESIIACCQGHISKYFNGKYQPKVIGEDEKKNRTREDPR